jgi:hypothetical protein
MNANSNPQQHRKRLVLNEERRKEWGFKTACFNRSHIPPRPCIQKVSRKQWTAAILEGV